MRFSIFRSKAGSNPKERFHLRKILLSLSVCLVVLLLMIEAGLQIVACFKPFVFLTPQQDRYWETVFLRRNSRETHLSEVHKTRGWTPRAGEKGDGITINDMGYRSPSPRHELMEGKYRVVTIGDSFTFGWGTHDSSTWPQLLESMNPFLQIINLGVGSYGIGQMYITLRETIDHYRPHLIIAAYIGDDLFRSLLSFRDYRKPKFVLEGDELVLTNTPIGTLRETRLMLDKKSYPPRFMTGVVLNLLYDRLFQGEKDIIFPDRESEIRCSYLNTRLIEEMMETSTNHGADFILLHLAHDRAIRDNEFVDYGEKFLGDFAADHEVNYVTTRDEFLKKNDWGDGHYGKKEAALVARQAYRKIIKLPSFKEFVLNKEECKY